MSGGPSTPPPASSAAQTPASASATGPPPSFENSPTDPAALRAELDATKKQLKDNEHQFAKLKSISRKALEEFHRVKDDLGRELAQRQETEDRLAKTHEELIREATRRKHLEQLLQATAARPDAYAATLTSPHGSPISAARGLPGSSSSASSAETEQQLERLRRDLAATKKDNARLASELTQVQAAVERAKAREREDQVYIDQLEQVIDDIKADLRMARRLRDDLEAELVATQEMLTAANAAVAAATAKSSSSSSLLGTASNAERLTPSVVVNGKMPPARPARPTLSDDDDDDSQTIRSKPGVLDAVDSDASGESALPHERLSVEDDDDVASDSDSIKSNRGNSRDATPPTRSRNLGAGTATTANAGEGAENRYSIVTSIVSAFDPAKDDLPPPLPDDAIAQRKRDLLREVQELEALRDKLQAQVAATVSPSSSHTAAAAAGESSTTVKSSTSGSSTNASASTPPPVPSKDANAPLPPVPQSAPAMTATAQVVIVTPTVINPQDVPREASLAHAAATAPHQPTVLIRPPRFASIPVEDNVEPDDSASQVGADDYADLEDATEQSKDNPATAAVASAAEPTSTGNPATGATSPLHGMTRAERKAMLTLDPITPLPPPRMAPSLDSPKHLGNVRDPNHATSPPARKTTFDSPSSSGGAISPAPPSPIPPLPLSKVETPPQDRSASPSLSIRDSPGMARRMSIDPPHSAVPASPSREMGFTYTGSNNTSTGLGAKRQKKPSKFNLGFSNMTSAFAKIKDKIADDLHHPHAHVYGPAAFATSSSVAPPTPSSSTPSTGSGSSGRKGSLKPASSPVPSPGLLSPPAPSAHDLPLDDAASAKSVHLTGDKSHIFQSTHFHKIVKCAQCGDRIWGSMGGAREMSCKCCGLIAHAKCAPLAPARCPGPAEGPGVPSPSKTASTKSPHLGAARWFGVDLTVALADKPPGTVPDIVELCIAAVEKIGMDVEGIYRKSGPSSLTKQAVADLDKGLAPDLANEDVYGDATVATSVLKQYLRDLPNPLITFGVYPLVKQAMHLAEKDAAAGVDAMRKALVQLPAAHLATLDRLFAHLHRVVRAQEVTRMTPRNLGVVFGPTLIRDTSRGESFFDMASIDVVEFMLERYDDVFTKLVPGAAGKDADMDVLDLNADESGMGSGASTPPTLPALNLPSLSTAEGLMDFSLLFDSKPVTPASEKDLHVSDAKQTGGSAAKQSANVSSSA